MRDINNSCTRSAGGIDCWLLCIFFNHSITRKTMTKNGLIAYTKAVRERIDILRSELQSEIDKASKEDNGDYKLLYDEFSCAAKFRALGYALEDFATLLGGKGEKE